MKKMGSGVFTVVAIVRPEYPMLSLHTEMNCFLVARSYESIHCENNQLRKKINLVLYFLFRLDLTYNFKLCSISSYQLKDH